jgi:hypothetical protein
VPIHRNPSYDFFFYVLVLYFYTIMVQFTSKLVLATIVAVPALSAPLADREDLKARGQSMSRMAVKGAENVFEAYGQNKAKETLKQYTSQPAHVDPGLAAAAKKASGPFNHAAVQAVVGFKQAGKRHGKRDFEGDFLEARGQTLSRVAVKGAENVFEAYGQNKAKETLKKYMGPAPVDPALAHGLAEAARKSRGPFNPLAVQAVVGFKQAGKRHGKRDFEDDFLEARGQSMSRMAVKGAENVFEAYGQNKAKETLKQYTSQPAHVDPGLAAAAKKASGPFNHAAVQAVVGFKQAGKRHGKREFEDDVYERDFEDDFLEARGQSMSRMAVKGAENVFEAYGQNKAKETLKQYTSQPAHVDPGLAAAAKKASGPFNHAAVQAVVGFKQAGKRHGKREFDDDLYERDFDEDVFERDFYDLEEREYYGDLEELD